MKMQSDNMPVSLPRAWWLALTRPSVETYRRLHQHPNASANRGFLGLVVALFVAGFLAMTAQVNLVHTVRVSDLAVFLILVGEILAVGLLVFLIVVSVVHTMARIQGGKARLDQLVYIFSLIMAPLCLLDALLSVTVVTWLAGSVIVLFYGAGLLVLAVSAVEEISLGKSAASVAVLLLPIGCCLFYFFLAVPAPGGFP